MLAVLEGYATALAAEKLGKAEIKRLSDLNDQMVEAIERLDPLSFGRLNQEFHAVIYEHCPNAALVGLLRDVARRLDAIRRTVFMQIPYRGAESVAEHKRLIDLIASALRPRRSRTPRASTSSAPWRASAPGGPSTSPDRRHCLLLTARRQ